MYTVGVDIGGTKIAAGVVDETGELLAATRRPTPADDAEALVAGVVEAITELRREHDVSAVGVVCPGLVSQNRSDVLFAGNLALRDFPLGARVADGVALPVVVENDANAAGWAEFRFGAGRDVSDMVMVTVGTGLGGAVVIGGNLLRGAYGAAGEIGHLRVVPDGRACTCGHFGCWETYASGTALVRETRAELTTTPERAVRLLELAGGKPKHVTGPTVTRAAQEGDPLSLQLLAELGHWLGAGMAGLSAVLDPAMYVVGGGVCAAGDLLLASARSSLADGLFAYGHRPVPTVTVAELGNDAGMVGAADLART